MSICTHEASIDRWRRETPVECAPRGFVHRILHESPFGVFRSRLMLGFAGEVGLCMHIGSRSVVGIDSNSPCMAQNARGCCMSYAFRTHAILLSSFGISTLSQHRVDRLHRLTKHAAAYKMQSSYWPMHSFRWTESWLQSLPFLFAPRSHPTHVRKRLCEQDLLLRSVPLQLHRSYRPNPIISVGSVMVVPSTELYQGPLVSYRLSHLPRP